MNRRQYYGQTPAYPEGTWEISRDQSEHRKQAEAAGLAFGGATSQNIARQASAFRMTGQSAGIIYQTAQAFEITREESRRRATASASGLAFQTVIPAQIARQESLWWAYTKEVGLTFQVATGLTIQRESSLATMQAKVGGIAFHAATSFNVVREPSSWIVRGVSRGLNFAGASSTTISRLPSAWSMYPVMAGLGFQGPGSHTISRYESQWRMSGNPVGLLFKSAGVGESAYLNGIDAYFHRAVSGYRTADNTGALVMWMKSDTTIGFGQAQSLFTGSQGDTPRIEFGLRDQDGETELYIESDDGTAQGTTFWRVPITGLDVFDNQWHQFVWMSDGDSYQVWVDGAQWFTGYGIDNGRWFAQIQTAGGGNFDRLSAGAFRRNGIVDQWYLGQLDESFVTDRLLDAAEITQLYNNRNGVLIPQLDSEPAYAPIWASTVNAWEFSDVGANDFGDDYIAGPGYWLEVLIEPGQDGIPGAL